MARLLIIDDDLCVRNLLRGALEKDGHTILDAADGKEGLNIFSSDHPDLVILDLEMPVMNGFEFLEKVKPEPEKPFLVIVLTGCDTEADLQLCFELGAGIFIHKPIDLAEIRRVVTGSLKLKQQHDAT